MSDEKIYCFDIDGVICELKPEVPYEDREPLYDTIKIMYGLRHAGATIILHTGRHINHLKVTKKWLKEYLVPYDHIQFGKPVADVYIDDLGVRFEEWIKCPTQY